MGVSEVNVFEPRHIAADENFARGLGECRALRVARSRVKNDLLAVL
jgi:hypothetical protein